MDANPSDESSSDLGSDDSFQTPDSSSGRFDVRISPNGSSSGRFDVRVSPNDSSSGRFDVRVSPNDSSSRHVDVHVSPKDSSSGRFDVRVSPNEVKTASNKQLAKCSSKIDTNAPFESVRDAVAKFGAIADWKAHRAQTNERRKFIEQELEKAQEEIPIFKQKSKLAEQAKQEALKHLDSTKRLLQELNLHLERAQTEERQAKQDSELAQLRLQELEQGITNESSVAAKTQLEVAKARHQTAASQLAAARTELEETRKDYQTLVSERDFAIEKAREEVSIAKELESEVENLTIQLITTKESIESIHVSHLEVEEHWLHEVNERDQELLSLDNELKQTEAELEKVKRDIALTEELKSKLGSASRLLHSLKDELAVYMQGKIPEKHDNEKFTRKDVQSGVTIAKKNLDEVHQNIEKVTEEIVSLKTAAKSLNAQLESEKQVLTSIRKQKGLGAGAVVNLETEIKRARLELDDIRRREKEAQEKLADLPTRLQKASEETENAKLFAEGARLVLKKAREAANQSKNEASQISSQLAKTKKEIEAARAQEKLALGAISALHESESARGSKRDSKGGITITLVEYYELTKRAHEAEEAANRRVAEATALIDEAKEAEMESLNKLTQLNSEIAARKEALNVALEKAAMAKESKANIENELSKQNGETPRENEGLNPKTKDDREVDSVAESSVSRSEGKSNSSSKSVLKSGSLKGLFKKRRSIMPKFSLMFVGKKKSSSHKSS